jgi:hypothetical protein
MSAGTSFTDVGNSLLGPFASRTPRQFEPKVTKPFPGLEPQQQAVEDLLGRSTQSRVGQVTNPFVGAGPQQQGALDALANFQGAATPAFHQGLGQLGQTIGGNYLDVANVPAFQNLASTRKSMAQDLFSDAMGRINSNMASQGLYDSLARERMGAEQARRVGTEAAHDVAQAGFQQYGTERGLQEAATQRGLALAPGLAESVFGAGEKLRSAEQQAATDELRAKLTAMGLDNEAIGNVLRYMQIAVASQRPYIKGSSPYEENLDRLSTEASAFGSVTGGMRNIAGG